MCISETTNGKVNGANAFAHGSTVVRLAYCKMPAEDAWLELQHELTVSWYQRIKKYGCWQDGCRHWIGRQLCTVLFNACGDVYDDGAVQFTKYGRPYVENLPDFNISHSGDFVIASVAEKGRIGIDIEQMNPVCIEEFIQTLSDTQLSSIKADKEPLRLFYRLWTLKESIGKLLGFGVALPLQNITSDFYTAKFCNQIFYLTELDIDNNHSCFIATDCAVSSIEQMEIDFMSLLSAMKQK